MTLILLYLIAALALSFLCSVLEAVLLSTPASFITLKEREGVKAATLFRRLKQDIDKPISAILSLNTIAHTIGAAGVGAEAVKLFGEAWFGVISAVLTILILVLSEIIPKTIGACYWRQLAMRSARIIHALIVICYPLVWLSEWITRLIAPRRRELSVSREEVSAMVTAGTEEGIFASKEDKIIQNLIRFNDIRAKSIMTPRVVAATASEEMTLREFLADTRFWPYSRIPLYGQNKEYITGYVLRQNVLEHLAEDRFDLRLRDIRRDIICFPDFVSVAVVWERLLASKEQISVILDEYGCFEGIITLEDVLETLLGEEITDEKDLVADMQQLAREKWLERNKKQSDREANKTGKAQ